MRNIAFRAKNTRNGGWVYGYLSKVDEITICTGISYEPVEVDKKTIGQYAGLRDRDGHQLFEEDIVQTHDRLGVCEFHNGMFVINDHDPDTPNTWSEVSTWKKIGNIYDHPERFPFPKDTAAAEG